MFEFQVTKKGICKFILGDYCDNILTISFMVESVYIRTAANISRFIECIDEPMNLDESYYRDGKHNIIYFYIKDDIFHFALYDEDDYYRHYHAEFNLDYTENKLEINKFLNYLIGNYSDDQ